MTYPPEVFPAKKPLKSDQVTGDPNPEAPFRGEILLNFGGVIIFFGRMALKGGRPRAPFRFPWLPSDPGPSDQHGEGMDMGQVAKRFLGEGSGSDRSKCFGGTGEQWRGVREVLEDTWK